jgi:hypothetical protein
MTNSKNSVAKLYSAVGAFCMGHDDECELTMPPLSMRLESLPGLKQRNPTQSGTAFPSSQ